MSDTMTCAIPRPRTGAQVGLDVASNAAVQAGEGAAAVALCLVADKADCVAGLLRHRKISRANFQVYFLDRPEQQARDHSSVTHEAVAAQWVASAKARAEAET